VFFNGHDAECVNEPQPSQGPRERKRFVKLADPGLGVA